MLQLIAEILTFTGSVFIAVSAALLLFYLFARAMQRYWDTKPAKRDAELDITHMTILFQSMRDMLRQQKELASEINDTIEKRVTFVRKTVDHALTELERIDARQRELAQAIAAMQEDVDEPPRYHDDLDTPVEIDNVNTSANGNGDHRSDDAILLLPDVPRPLMGAPEDPEASWVGIDFGEDDAQQPADPTPPPEAPENAEAARDAFRALLNMDEPAATATTDEPSNGNHSLIHGRVYEYADAGMTVPHIARELGIGKGEVRLILGLRKDQEA